MKGFSFSAMGRIAACAPSAIFPRSETSTDYAAKGVVVHAYLRDVNAMGAENALERVPAEHRVACEAIDLSALPASKPDAYAAEVSFAYAVETGEAREIGRNLERGYEGLLGPREIPGTLDVIGLTEDAVVVLDYKSGFADLGPAKENWQLRIGALAAARAYGRSRAHVGIIRITEDGEPRYQRADLTELDLDATEEAIRQVVDRVERAEAEFELGRQPTTVEGAHCKYCPAFNFCPAKRSLAREIVGAGKPVLPELLDDDTAAIAIQRLEALEGVVKRAWEVLEERARIRPIPLGKSAFFGPLATSREKLNAEKVVEVLDERFGAEIALALEVKQSTTKEALKAALRKHVAKTPGAKITKVFDATMEALREAGGAETSVTYPCKVYTPEEPKALPASNDQKSTAA
jgi:hypothetical protein